MHHFNVTHCLHYVDDFFLAGPPQSEVCDKALSDMLLLCKAVQTPVKLEKTLSPSTTLSFLDIEFDMLKGEACLPNDKLAGAA